MPKSKTNITETTDKKLHRQLAEALASANFTNSPEDPPDQMFDIAEKFGLRIGDMTVGECDTDLVKLFHALDEAAAIANTQAETLNELAAMLRQDLLDRSGIAVTPQCEEEPIKDHYAEWIN